ncbi:MAG: PD-(D/E)XK nuclease family protein [Alphaproteobacteria bacterium]|nr:PD-(D/E)XK nuclease family protein [Alphaproteobacteria bacterium]
MTGPKHSKRRTRSRREIDIFIEIIHDDQTRSALLIENKIDAEEQPDQAESYREELDVLSPDYDVTAMIVVCPEGYRAQHYQFISKFDVCLTYQSIRDWFVNAEKEAGDEAVLRYRFRAELFDQAIYKHRRGYTSIPDSVVGDFNAKYVKMLAELAPQISPGNSMLKPANPRESTSMIFNQNKSLAEIPSHIRPRRFAHELGRGSDRRANYVAVTFAGWGVFLPAIHERLQTDTTEIGASFSAKPPNKSRPNPGLIISIPTEPVDNQGSFSAQQDMLADGIETVLSLRKWLVENPYILQGWKVLIDEQKRRLNDEY